MDSKSGKNKKIHHITFTTSPLLRHLDYYKYLLIPDNTNVDTSIKYFNSTMLFIHNTMISATLDIESTLER